MSATQEYLTLCRREQWEKGRFWQAECRGDTLALAPGAFRGVICLPAVDGGETGFPWSRLRLNAVIPRDAGVQVYALASDAPAWPELETGPAPDGAYVAELFGPPKGGGTDLWLRESGRYLYLALELTAGGPESPEISAVSLRISGDHMVDYLPAIYRNQDFTYRYLSIFNSMFQDMEREIDELPREFSPESASPEMLGFLAQWLCVHRTIDPAWLRNRLYEILAGYETMYTPGSIRENAALLAGREPWLIEYFMVDFNDRECPNPALYRKLYGEDPYRFFLLFPQDTFTSQNEIERFLDGMRELIPAGTELELVLLKPCVQLDWHTYLGINSSIGSFVPAQLNEMTAIHYDATIGGEHHEQ